MYNIESKTDLELIEYYKKLRKEYEELPFDEKSVKKREHIHGLIIAIVGLLFKRDIIVHNEHRLDEIPSNCIYVVNHSNAYDFPTAAVTVKKHFYILADANMKNDKVVNALNELNGVVYVDRRDRESKNKSKDELIKLLVNGKSILIFPEGTWNLTTNLLMLPMNWGVIDIAKISEKPIVPITINYDGKKKHVNIGKRLYIFDGDDKKEKIEELRDYMATLRWEVMEQLDVLKRADFRENEEERYVEEMVKTYKKTDFNEEKSLIIKTYDTPEEVFAPIKKLRF